MPSSHTLDTVTEFEVGAAINLLFVVLVLCYSPKLVPTTLQCSVQVFKRAGCHLKRAHLVRCAACRKGTIIAVNWRKRAISAC